VKPPPLAYARAESADEAVSFLAETADEAKLLAGGQSLVPLLNFRLARPGVLVDINALVELEYVRLDDTGALRLGALCRHAQLERSAPSEAPWQAVGEAARMIAHLPIRTRGTVGGSLAHADPSAELPLLCVALGAEIDAVGPGGTRTITADDFFHGTFSTALAPDELLVEARLPAPPGGASTAFEEFSERAGDFALAAVCAGVAAEAQACSWARVALGGVSSTPLRVPEAEDVLVGSDLGDDVLGQAAEAAWASCDPPGDFHGSSEFRRELMHELTLRALRRARDSALEDPS
jgi:carbon-monoxide dehydrogenase medium subunit/6-hydroxypseudooxynicotine dehydrogenase subunit alpha